MTDNSDELRAQIASCRGMTTQQIADAFADIHQDDLTRELLKVAGERTAVDLLPRTPFTIRHSLYGDTAISEWHLHHRDDPTVQVDHIDNVNADAHARWERWEDVVRLINADVQAMSLFMARRITTVGDRGTQANATRWFLAVNWANLPEEKLPGKLLLRLRACAGDQARIARFVDGTGLTRILEARAQVVAMMFTDLGASRDLTGTSLVWQIDGHPSAIEITFTDNAWSSANVPANTLDERLEADAPTLVVLRYTQDGLLGIAGSWSTHAQVQISGGLRILGSDTSIKKFQTANRRTQGS